VTFRDINGSSGTRLQGLNPEQSDEDPKTEQSKDAGNPHQTRAPGRDATEDAGVRRFAGSEFRPARRSLRRRSSDRR
jgi:hypothetical protein